MEQTHHSDCQTIAAYATPRLALEMWMRGDWDSYNQTRNLLVEMIRSERGERLRLPQLQFIYFINKECRGLVGDVPSDEEAFLLTSPAHMSHVVDLASQRPGIGQVVTLNSGGHAMTVAGFSEADPSICHCVWSDAGCIHQGNFHMALLTRP